MKTHELTSCPGCRGGRTTRVVLDGSRGEHVLYGCPDCDLVYAQTFADPSEIYVDGYLTGDAGDFGLDISHPTYQLAMDWFSEKRLRLVEAHAAGTGSLLDVGCGSGELIRNALRRGWQATGVEPVQASADTARAQGLDVIPTDLESSGLPERSFDVVTAYHVLEHIPDAQAFLRTMARWARPGGLVVVEVPNFDSIQRRNQGSAWPGLRPLEHISHFSPDTLHRAITSAGLEPIEVRTNGFLWRHQTLEHMLHDLGHARWKPMLRPLCHHADFDGRRMLKPSAPLRGLLLAVQWAYDRRGVGQVVTGVARVPATAGS